MGRKTLKDSLGRHAPPVRLSQRHRMCLVSWSNPLHRYFFKITGSLLWTLRACRPLLGLSHTTWFVYTLSANLFFSRVKSCVIEMAVQRFFHDSLAGTHLVLRMDPPKPTKTKTNTKPQKHTTPTPNKLVHPGRSRMR